MELRNDFHGAHSTSRQAQRGRVANVRAIGGIITPVKPKIDEDAKCQYLAWCSASPTASLAMRLETMRQWKQL